MQIPSSYSDSSSMSGATKAAKQFGSAMETAKTEAGAHTKSQASGGMQQIMSQLKELIQQLSQLIQAMSQAGGPKGASVSSTGGGVQSVGGSGSGLGGTQGASEKIPDPTQNIQEVKLGGKTMTIGGDGSASAGEVDSAAGELKRMYDTSPTFRRTIDSADGQNLTVTLGRRGDNTSWGGGSRVFLNVNNITAGNNDTFQEIAGHEFGHAAGLSHGAQLDSIQSKVRAEA